jgi:hypothetical protein
MFPFHLNFLQRELVIHYGKQILFLIIPALATIGILILICYIAGPIGGIVIGALLFILLIGAYFTVFQSFLRHRHDNDAPPPAPARTSSVFDSFHEITMDADVEGGNGEVGDGEVVGNSEGDGVGNGEGESAGNADIGEPAHQVGVLNGV